MNFFERDTSHFSVHLPHEQSVRFRYLEDWCELCELRSRAQEWVMSSEESETSFWCFILGELCESLDREEFFRLQRSSPVVFDYVLESVQSELAVPGGPWAQGLKGVDPGICGSLEP